MKKFAVCGVSNRAMGMFIKPIISTFENQGQLVGLLDIDPKRFKICKNVHPETAEVPEYDPSQFEKMIVETQPDTIIVAGRDDTHAGYIIKALEHDLDVITEKPMATTGIDCQRIMDAEARSKGKVTVTFNYRYSPVHTRIKEMILEDKVGRITSVDLNWYIDTRHGSSYFKRWNRERQLSGGLTIHKSSHHLDLVNWWLDQKPVEAFSYGALNYFGAKGELNPEKEDGRFCATCGVKHDCKYFMRWNTRSGSLDLKDDHIEAFAGKKNAAAYTDYRPDRCVFDSEIEIEDTYTATVRYDRGSLLSYSINFSVPYEGYRLAINGTKGRLETVHFNQDRTAFPTPPDFIDYYPLFGAKETIYVVHREGGHGGGDPVLREDIFLGVDPNREYQILSGAVDGSYAVATGEAIWRSVKEHRPITIKEVLQP